MRRARWAMEIRSGARAAKLNVKPEWVRGLSGGLELQFNVYAVDSTRDGRDPQAGEPLLLNDVPFLNEGDAQEFAKGALVGRRTYWFGGHKVADVGPKFRRHLLR